MDDWPALEQAWVDAWATQRETWWLAANVAASVSRTGDRRTVRTRLRQLATAGGISLQQTQRLARVGTAYDPGVQYPDVPFWLYWVCLAAAKRLGEPPAAVLGRALAEHATRAQVQAWGSPRSPRADLRLTCGACGARVGISVRGYVGTVIRCPVCHDSEPLGTLQGCDPSRP